MKIRAITVGSNIRLPTFSRRATSISSFIASARKTFEACGYRVQTTRLTSQPWPEYLADRKSAEIIRNVKLLERFCQEHSIDFLSIGTAYGAEQIEIVPHILSATSIVSTSATIARRKNGIDHDATKAAAHAIVRIARTSSNGAGNFRFAALANCPADIPFFPASYHQGRTCFMVALESGDLLFETLTAAGDIVSAQQELTGVLQTEYKKVERIARRLEMRYGILFRGIDTSPAPSLLRRGSVALAIERIGQATFGAPGTIAAAGMITDVLRSLKLRRCGFSGLMLPVMEDAGLAKRIGKLSIHELLAYSAVCGTGLDCVPLPGDTGAKKIKNLLLDVATMALKLDKPLSARLLPMPGHRAGSMTRIRSPYLINCRIPILQ